MSEAPVFDCDLPDSVSGLVTVSPLVRRLVAPNPGPLTATGTCTYIVGRGEIAIIDPGPDLPSHVAALLEAVAGEQVTHVVITHSHHDHSPAARIVAEATGATMVGCGPHRRARPLAEGEEPREGGDLSYRPDREMAEGDVIVGPGWSLEAVATPGHTANHLAFALAQEQALFSGDHVMGWSTTFIGPPDGSMGSYMASLDKLLGRTDSVYWPGHGGAVRDPQLYVRALIQHRRQREAQIVACVDKGVTEIPAMVAAIYEGLSPALTMAAGLSVFAHLEDLVERGTVVTDGPATLRSRYRPA
jgi:glyoxylase-like metal-dependent hydrolase (beta-lactamase superfamily II)